MSLSTLYPVPTLLERARAELSAAFHPGEATVARSPARLDVMGGLAEETGSVTCSIQLDRPAASVLVQPRDDGLLQVFSFNELDAHRPFTLCMPIAAIAGLDAATLRQSLNEPGRQWAWSAIGAVWAAMGERQSLRPELCGGINIALLNTIPPDIGLAAHASAITAALAAIKDESDSLQQSITGRRIEAELLTRASPLSAHLAAATRLTGVLHRFQADTQTSLPPLPISSGMRIVAIDTSVVRSAIDRRLQIARVAVRAAHQLILNKMRDMGVAAGRTLVADPMGGFLARLDSADYKRWFRPYLPEAAVGSSLPPDPEIEPEVIYPIRGIADHHVLDALRVRNFAKFLEQANAMPVDEPARGIVLDKCGHLMYASHQSLSGDAGLGFEQADLLVRLIRRREPHGLYGARLTGTGRGGVVAVLCEDNDRATAALADVLADYSAETGLVPVTYRTAAIGENAPRETVTS